MGARKHLQTFNIEVRYEEVRNLTGENLDGFSIQTNKHNYTTQIVVIASGTQPVTSQFNTDFIPGRIFYDLKNLSSISGKNIAIIGAGDAAFDYALNLSTKENEIRIFNWGSRVRALGLLYSRAMKNHRIGYFQNHRLEFVSGGDKGELLSLDFDVDNLHKVYQADYLIFAIGRKPALDFIDPSLRTNQKSLVDEKKLFFIGDVTGSRYRQASIAAGEGIKTAMVIFYEGNKENRV